MDSDDYELQFDAPTYQSTLIKSEHLYENFLSVSAKDHDCTNNGLACSYSLEHELTVVDEFPFSISTTGQISTKRSLTQAGVYDFRVRAYDCVNNKSFVEVPVHVDIIEPCVPQWTGNFFLYYFSERSTPQFFDYLYVYDSFFHNSILKNCNY